MVRSRADKTTRSLADWTLKAPLHILFLTVLTSVLAAIARIVPIELQRRIVDDAILGSAQDQLYPYCFWFFVSTVAALGLKYAMLGLQCILGERSLLAIRKAFFTKSLLLPQSFFHKNRPGALVTTLINELGPVGDYLGTAWSMPIVNILTLTGMGAYLASLNPMLSLLSLSVYPVSMLLLPSIQRSINSTNAQRAQAGQRLGGKIAETVSGIADVQAHAGYGIENNEFSDAAEELKRLRLRLTLKRLLAKNINNFFMGLSPLLVFLVGGTLALQGKLHMGELVAFLSAQAMLYSPWRELADHYQSWQEAKTRYTRVQHFFSTPLAQNTNEAPSPVVAPVSIAVQSLSLTTENGRQLLDDLTLTIEHGEMVALVGPSGGGKSSLIKCLAGQTRSYHGDIFINDTDLRDLSSLDLARFTGLLSQSPYVFSGTIEDNLLYPLRALTKTAGRPFNPPCLDDRIFALQQSGLYLDVLHFGLNMRLNETLTTALGERILPLRHLLHDTEKQLLKEFVSIFEKDAAPFQKDEFSREHSFLENLVYGRLLGNDMASNEALLARLVPVLLEHDLLETVLEAGLTHQVGTNGERISGGQRQRLVLASILMKKPAVFLLDEAGSALDSHSRAKLRELFARLKKHSTIISVEHNLEHMQDFDRIMVMQHGRIVENGTYGELSRLGTAFQKLLSET